MQLNSGGEASQAEGLHSDAVIFLTVPKPLRNITITNKNVGRTTSPATKITEMLPWNYAGLRSWVKQAIVQLASRRLIPGELAHRLLVVGGLVHD